MPDPRTQQIILYDLLSQRLHDEMVARDEAWADYWQRRRVVVVPERHESSSEDRPWPLPVFDTDVAQELARGTTAFHRPTVIGAMTEAVMTTDAIAARQNGDVIRDCIARLKAAREREAVNKNLSTLLAVVVKVQRDLEALLNGEAK